MSSKSAAATNSFLVLNAPTKKVQDYKQEKPTGAIRWVWNHFSVYGPKYNRESQAVCNHGFLKYTKDPDGKTIDGDCANWEISYGLSRSTSKLRVRSVNSLGFTAGMQICDQADLKRYSRLKNQSAGIWFFFRQRTPQENPAGWG